MSKEHKCVPSGLEDPESRRHTSPPSTECENSTDNLKCESKVEYSRIAFMREEDASLQSNTQEPLSVVAGISVVLINME